VVAQSCSLATSVVEPQARYSAATWARKSCRAANARPVKMPSRRAISDAVIGSARYIAATRASDTAGPAVGKSPIALPR